MLFNSPEFAVFFPLVTLGYYLLPHRLRWVFLLMASLGFYMAWRPVYVLVLLLLIVIDWYAGRAMAETDEPGRRRRMLLLSIIGNLGLLFVFKYAVFLMGSAAAVLHAVGVGWTAPVWEVLLPVGISFHTFQALSYTSDVYRGRVAAERSLGRFALFVTYFPQLVAGPIERAGRLMPELRKEVRLDAAGVGDGLRIMAWGLFKKVVVADRLARGVDVVYADPGAHHGPVLVLATVFFALQIYCDFSGYSDMALGAAKVLGVDLTVNFRTPYRARSVQDFWHRWHISLSTWFRDYVYLSLGGNRVGAARWCFNVLAVFLLSGLWHGASWTFVLWGAFHGVWMVTSRLSQGGRERMARALGLARVPRLHAALQTGITFVLVCVGWVLFRARTLGDALTVLGGIGRGWEALAQGGRSMLGAALGLSRTELLLAFFFAGLLVAVEAWAGDTPPMSIVARAPRYVRWLAYYALVSLILMFGVFENSPFIYFQF